MTNERRRRATTGRSVRTGQSEEEDAEHQLGCSLHVESFWCLVRWPPDGQHHQNGAFLLGKIITKPPSRNSCNCHRPWPPYGGWPYTSPIECLHTLTTQSAKPAQQDNQPTRNQERGDLHNFSTSTKEKAALAISDALLSPGDARMAPAHLERQLSLFLVVSKSVVGILAPFRGDDLLFHNNSRPPREFHQPGGTI